MASQAIIEGSVTPTLPFDAFLTAYDPSDLPGGSIDPLGFERGYLFLAEKLLPGLTNVADRPRYLSLLCAGASLAKVDLGTPRRQQYEQRLACVLRLEKLWALGNVLAASEEGGRVPPPLGVRGVNYAKAAASRLIRRHDTMASANFQLLLRQIPYGVVGIYGAVAEGMRLIERGSLAPSPGLGEVLADAFLTETGAPQGLLRAVREDGDVSLRALAKWGVAAHVGGPTTTTEARCLSEAADLNPVRKRMLAILATYPKLDAEGELHRLSRIGNVLEGVAEQADLREVIRVILADEEAYRIGLLGFERLLWLCRVHPAGAVAMQELHDDPVLRTVCEALPAAVAGLCRRVDAGASERFREGLQVLDDVRRFLAEAAGACGDGHQLALVLLTRHTDVQRGKFNRGRRKMPWLEVLGGRLGLTTTRVGGLDYEATGVEQIAPHPYRLRSADALLAAGRVQ